MDFEQVLAEIKTFWVGDPLPFQGGGEAEVARVQSLFTQKFPNELKQYIGEVLPPNLLIFEAVGYPLYVYGFTELSTRVPGYSVDAITGEPISDWNPGWLVIADAVVSPVIVDLRQLQESVPHCTVFAGPDDGTKSWDFAPIADSLPQFLLLAVYLHHALTAFGDVIIHDEKSVRLRLADEAADWLFPRIKHCAPEYYAWWVGVFDNA